jgi:hypothetical protein
MEENPYKAQTEFGSSLSISQAQRAPISLGYRLGVATLIFFDIVFVALPAVAAVYRICYWWWNRR